MTPEVKESSSPAYFNVSITEALQDLTTTAAGLNSHHAEVRLHQYGLNELKAEKEISPVTIFVRQFASPLVWILLGALVLSVMLREYTDGAIIGIIVFFNAVFGFKQEYSAEKAIETLQKMASLKAKVLRDGKEKLIDSKYLVPGDIIILETGDKVPADARLIEVHTLETQEAELTGESSPILKTTDVLPESTVLADRKNMIYAGTIITNGRGKAVITGTGMRSEVGKIASLIQESKEELTPLQVKLKRLGIYLTIAVMLVAVIVFIVGTLSGQKVTTMFLTAIALAVAAIPEGLPAVITISLALGVQRMVKKNALIRRLPSVETLGSVDVICTDKTGTLTHNEMTVTRLWTNAMEYHVSGSGYNHDGKFLLHGKEADLKSVTMLLKAGALCNDAKLEGTEQQREVFGDPTEAALLVSAEKAGIDHHVLNSQEQRINEIPFSSERKMMTTIHKVGKEEISYTKGAPDVILEHCNKILINGKVQLLTRPKKKEILEQNELFAKEALRILGFSYKENSPHQDAEKEMIFIGLQAMIDPPRLEAKESIKKCQEAGIRVIMITGDHRATAEAIAKQLGITGRAITGQELMAIRNLETEIAEIGVFARVNPEYKDKIVDALKKNGHIVAMTGDGVNDAPALKKADIGISMGVTGTDVAKEASDMILTDDNFTSIVNAVEEGRGIFDNIRKFVNYILSSNLAEVLVLFLAMIVLMPFFGMGIPLLPIHILWINLVTDGLPAIALGIDPHDAEIMKRKPRDARENIISRAVSIDIITAGVLMSIIILILFWLYRGSPLDKAQTIVFTLLVSFQMVRLQIIRSAYKLDIFSNKYMVLSIGISLLSLIILMYTPLNNYFKIVPLELMDWVLIAIASGSLAVMNKIIYKLRKSIPV
ncbi:MAG: calcium-translocating P-type ATPase, SERCA-type [Nanoarchaeota archaeon]|nr:calcium-translocating P-type ATPase, SERCA-type [Nanoarchaeota archaeon]